MKINLYKTHTTRDCRYVNIEKDIFDEDYSKEVTLFNLFTTKRTFSLKNIMGESNTNSIGFGKKR